MIMLYLLDTYICTYRYLHLPNNFHFRVRNFEYTSECIVFDLLTIPLYHGWLVDAENPNDVAAVGNCSYNQLVEKVITQKNSPKEELVTEGINQEILLP